MNCNKKDCDIHIKHKLQDNIKYFIMIVLMIICINTLGWNIYLNERYKALEKICFPQETREVILENRNFIEKHYQDILKEKE